MQKSGFSPLPLRLVRLALLSGGGTASDQASMNASREYEASQAGQLQSSIHSFLEMAARFEYVGRGHRETSGTEKARYQVG